MSHSQLLWKQGKNLLGTFTITETGTNKQIGQIEDKDNATLIVQAVNNQERLVGVIKDLIYALQETDDIKFSDETDIIIRAKQAL